MRLKSVSKKRAEGNRFVCTYLLGRASACSAKDQRHRSWESRRVMGKIPRVTSTFLPVHSLTRGGRHWISDDIAGAVIGAADSRR